ncbi:MAG TPA: hypothetical protein VNG53_07275 [Bacteroidia bacterium]|nr:hypothetical protein [Bacteroidia bacterium]
MKRSLLLLLIFGWTSQLSARTDSLQFRQNYIDAKYNVLRSTHVTYFTGGDISWGKDLNSYLSMKLGVEYAHCPFHNDNGWNLYSLNFIPVYITTDFHLCQLHQIQPFIQISQGISFNSYLKTDQQHQWPSYWVKERGYYVYLAVGSKIRITKKISFLLLCGFKGYRMSFNVLDVNPHGFTVSTGIEFI